ncbi:MAG: hypothetical protein KUG78_15005 [Kangiellaceae bacterium]|nr:hypothetical protein [Kangiellaceae bacterium]
MRYYKEQLLNKLMNSGWELDSRDDDTDWWVEEFWSMKSVRQNYGFIITVGFLVDLQYDGNNKREAVNSICACVNIPNTYSEAGACLSMYLSKGKLEETLQQFVKDVNKIRDQQNL